MTLAPRFLVNLWAAMRVARFARRQKRLGRGTTAQQRILAERLAQVAPTAFGREHRLRPDLTYAQFRAQVPLRNHEGFAAYIRRMAAGETDVLVPGRCPLFVESAGATGAAPKLFPVPDAMLAHFRQALGHAVLQYAVRAGHAGVFLGRHLQVGASTALREEGGIFFASLDGLVALCVTPWVEANLHSPAPPVAALPESAGKIEAVAQHMLGRDVTLLAGTPATICALADAAREAASSGKRRMTHLQAVWPNLECFLHTGAPLGLFADTLRQSLGPSVMFHEVYAAAEGIFAAQDAGAPPAMRLLTDDGVFFEFLPYSAYQDATLAAAGEQCVTLENVQPHKHYVPVITTPAGLVRYVIDDVVRFASVDPPRLQFVGRASLQLNSQGERVGERDVFETLQAVCGRNGWQAIAFHVAPYVQRLGPGQVANVHEWWLELRTHSIKTPTANVLGPELDAELARRCPDYAARRAQGKLGAPQIRLVIPGVFERWAQQQKRTASASKLARCRSDRLIADQLAALAPFHQITIVPGASTSMTA